MSARRFAILMFLILALSMVCLLPIQSASADEMMSMKDWLKMTEHQGTIAPGTKITMQNWRQYEKFMPPGMIALFEGTYFWKMPKDVETDVAASPDYPLPRSLVMATEKYGNQTQVVHEPDGSFNIRNYVAGQPFPNPQQPDKGYKILADLWFGGAGAHIYVHSPDTSSGSSCTQDRFGNKACVKFDIVYRRLAFNSDPGIPRTEPGAAGAFFTQWVMIESPEQSRYTAALTIYWQDPTKFQDDYVFVPTLRRSLRLSTTARRAPFLGSDMVKDDQNTGYSAGLGIMEAKFLGQRKILALTDLTTGPGGYPGSFDWPLGWAKPSWGKWSVEPADILDIRRIPSRAAGYCYGKKIMFVHAKYYYPLFNTMYDANMKPWKIAQYAKGPLKDPASGQLYPVGDYIEEYWDIQNNHASYVFGSDGPGRHIAINGMVPPRYLNIGRYSTPGGMMKIMK